MDTPILICGMVQRGCTISLRAGLGHSRGGSVPMPAAVDVAALLLMMMVMPWWLLLLLTAVPELFMVAIALLEQCEVLLLGQRPTA